MTEEIIIENAFHLCQRLEQENKELKARIKHQCYKCRIGDTTEDKLRSALEEIRKITEEDRNCMNSELACCQLCDKLDLIQDKINEVLNDN